MYCPNCGKKSEGKWCSNCGTRLEIEEKYDLNPYENEKGDTGKIPRSELGDFSAEDLSDDKLSSFDPYGDYQGKEGDKRKKIIIAISVCAAVIIAAIILIAVMSSPDNEDEIASDGIEVSETELEFEKGERYIDIGEYESAEEIFKKIVEADDNDEAKLLYKILTNYNRAFKAMDEGDYREASKYYNKIPSDYSNYAINDDVELLSDEISRYETAYQIFESISKFMDDKNYKAAKESIGIIDEDALGNDEREELKKFKDEIEENELPEVELSEHEAEDILRAYCEGFIKAINQNDFSLVAPYMYEGSEIYNTQKALMESYVKSGITESLDSFKLNSLSKVSDNTWQAKVTEAETINYKNGSSESKSFNWTYTIEYIDSAFYLTKMK